MHSILSINDQCLCCLTGPLKHDLVLDVDLILLCMAKKVKRLDLFLTTPWDNVFSVVLVYPIFDFLFDFEWVWAEILRVI